ncbi:MAG TPA: hypothetical protein VD993_21010 [Chitinophagaceae bacterium]|nr:hypothetical protein [Chitinophagaceae bacterium]
MQKIYGALACMLLSVCALGQTLQSTTPDYTRPAAIGVQFFLNDYESAANIRSGSLGSVFLDKKFGKIKEMSPGLAIVYIKGISNHLDYTVTASGSFVDYPLQNRPASGSDKFLLEIDASVVGKMFTDRYWVIPTISLGAGFSKYGVYYGAYLPAGVGLQLNFFDEAYLVINSQYRIPVTETANYHFYHSIGIMGSMFKKNNNGDATGKRKALPGLPITAR